MTFKQQIEETPLFKGNLIEYLRASINSESDKKKLCLGWKFLKDNLTEDLKIILLNEEYLKIVYNAENMKFILNRFNLTLNEELSKQLSSFIFVWKSIKREIEERQKAKELKEKLEKEGFKEQNTDIEELKKLDGLKVICVMDISKIGLMGSFDKKEQLEGTFKFSEYQKSLMLIPKRSRTKGYLIRKLFYYKEIKCIN
jgi:hypothetical protein